MELCAINLLNSTDRNFSSNLSRLTSWEAVTDHEVETVVDGIIFEIRKRGDLALLEFTNRYDDRRCESAEELVVHKDELEKALGAIDDDLRASLEKAALRISDYHKHQLEESWQFTEADGTSLGQKITAIERVGIYVPGGKASYPSSVLMNALPARVAGVDEIIMTVPSPKGQLNPSVLASAAIAGVTKVFTIGGAQAIAAMAFGTELVPKVDKIVGPGNSFVATAKRKVFGSVGLDMVAGPSEILVICDGMTDPEWVAMDLFSQAEHDEDAQSILLAWDDDFLSAVHVKMTELLPQMERRDIISKALSSRGALIRVKDASEAVYLSNLLSPEHLELSVENPERWLPQIRNAGAIFMGRYTSEVLGDYCAGPNHVLPTSSTARFSSPLGVYDFQKRSSVIHCTIDGAAKLGQIASVLAHSESLAAHARAAELRIEVDN
ncbi:MAG: histidinol dehydrogenase [Cellvibrionales bacterium TMED148]|nr:histidinol dehydrogenase [Porticoccaceae bacterium]RPG91201.1 MAG: histidinol dehydrogenase [Cellvibrionales bacterium TMED148]